MKNNEIDQIVNKLNSNNIVGDGKLWKKILIVLIPILLLKIVFNIINEILILILIIVFTLKFYPDSANSLKVLLNKIFKKNISNCLSCNQKKEIILSKCNHNYCKECLTKTILTSLSINKTALIKCPENCNNYISPNIIVQLLQSEKNQYFKVSTDEFLNRRQDKFFIVCLNTNCEFTGVYAKPISSFNCPSCKFSVCLGCFKELHNNPCMSINIKTLFNKFEDILKEKKNKRSQPSNTLVAEQFKKSFNAFEPISNFKSNPDLNITQISNRQDQNNSFYSSNTNIFNENSNVISSNESKPNNRINTDINKNENSAFKGINKKDGTLDMRYSINREQMRNNDDSMMNGGLNNIDGTPDMRYSLNKSIISNSSIIENTPRKRDGTEDMRFSVNKEMDSNNSKNNINRQSSGVYKKDGTLDMRYSVNKESNSNISKNNITRQSSGIYKKDGTLDMRYSVNKDK